MKIGEVLFCVTFKDENLTIPVIEMLLFVEMLEENGCEFLCF